MAHVDEYSGTTSNGCWELNYPFHAAHAYSNSTQLKFLIKITTCAQLFLHGNLKTLDPSTL